jgi:hypothetical protein
MDLDALRHEPPRQPEPGPSSLVGSDHAIDRVTDGSSASSVAINCCQQSILVRLDGALRLGSRQTRHLRCQYLALVAQLNRENERLIVIDGAYQYVRRP